MKYVRLCAIYGVVVLGGLGVLLAGKAGTPQPEYMVLAGSTHAHTALTWSHGDQFAKNGCAGVQTYTEGIWTGQVTGPAGCALMFVINSVQYPGPGMKVRPDWQEHQGLPSKHFELAKANGYDFYVTTDHSQDAAFHPQDGGKNLAWEQTKESALQATDSKFVALAGFEYSENDGPGGVGHLNVINSAEMVNALAPGMDLPHMYRWLEKTTANGDGPVVASFNHPGPNQYNNWDYRTPGVTDKITLLEVINSNSHIHYEAFVNALDKGWKVSPVCGNDNHGTGGITRNTSRTFVLAADRTKRAILEAMKNRRTYASLDKNIRCQYKVNGAIMGSTLKSANSFKFEISIDDPNTNNPNDKITKIDIVKDGGAVVQTYTPDTPDYTVRWSPEIKDATSKFFFVRVWNAGGGDAPGADPAKPIAWLAPVWTGK